MTVTTTCASVADPQGPILKGGDLKGQIVIWTDVLESWFVSSHFYQILFDSNRFYYSSFPFFICSPRVTPKILRSKLRWYPQQQIHALVHRTCCTASSQNTKHLVPDTPFPIQRICSKISLPDLVPETWFTKQEPGSRNLVPKPDSWNPVCGTLAIPGNWIAGTYPEPGFRTLLPRNLRWEVPLFLSLICVLHVTYQYRGPNHAFVWCFS